MAHVVVRDQGSAPNCFAQVDAQIIDAWRFSHGDANYAFQTSALTLTFDYWGSILNGKPFSNPEAKGNTSTAVGEKAGGNGSGANFNDGFAIALKNGVCDKSKTIESVEQQKVKELFEIVQSTLSIERKQALLPSGLQAPFEKDKAAQKFAKFFSKFDNGEVKCLQESDSDPTLPLVENFMKILRDPHADSLIAKILGESCAPQSRLAVHLPKPKPHIAFREPEATVAENIQNFLGEPNAQPIPLSLCAKVLYQNKAFRGRTSDGGLSKECMDEIHTVLAVGSRPHGNKCQILLRSSWGTSCAGFGAGWDCESKSGGAWVDEDVLIGSLSTYAVLEDPVHP